MKKLRLILSVVLLASCSLDDDSGDVVNNEFEEIETIVPQGTWEVTNYTEGETNLTASFESFIFTFNEDGTVFGENDLFAENGTWAYDNSSTEEERFNLQFGQTTPFDLISENWVISSLNNNEVELMVTSGNNGEPETLTFTKL